MQEIPADFGTGLRAHLGLEQQQPAPRERGAEQVVTTLEPTTLLLQEGEQTALDALEALETELLEREHDLSLREAALAGRAGSLLAAAQTLYDEILGGGPAGHDDELGRLRRRKSVA